jgi:hypothetical protein
MSASHDSRDAGQSTTSRMIFGLLVGNVFAILAIVAYPLANPSANGTGTGLIWVAGMLSLMATALLSLASAMRRGSGPWWVVAVALNLTQVGRLVPAVVAIALWADSGDVAGIFWAFVLVPFLGVLAAVGVVMTLRQLRRSRRSRRLVTAA